MNGISIVRGVWEGMGEERVNWSNCLRTSVQKWFLSVIPFPIDTSARGRGDIRKIHTLRGGGGGGGVGGWLTPDSCRVHVIYGRTIIQFINITKGTTPISLLRLGCFQAIIVYYYTSE